MKNDNLGNLIKKALDEKSKEISSDNLNLQSIYIKLDEMEENNMKLKFFNKKAIIVAVAAVVILATGVVAATSRIAYTTGHSSRLEEMNHFPSSDEIMKCVDFVPKYTETLGGYNFKFAVPVHGSDRGENDEILATYDDIDFWYDAGDDVILSMEAHNGSDKMERAVQEGKGICTFRISKDDIGDKVFYYSDTTHKSVPVDYELTEEDKKAEEEGTLQIGYGASELKEQNCKFIMWEDDGITYSIIAMGSELTKEDMLKMAEEIIIR